MENLAEYLYILIGVILFIALTAHSIYKGNYAFNDKAINAFLNTIISTIWPLSIFMFILCILVIGIHAVIEKLLKR